MAAPTLTQFQQKLSQGVLRQDDNPPASCFLQAVTAGVALSSGSALDVYRNGHIVRLTEALGETYEAIWWVAGDEAFFRLAKHFILPHHSETYNLSAYGNTFPAFLEQECPFPDLPFLPDLARFEWIFKEIFHSPQHEPVSPEMIREIAHNGALRFSFGPSVQLFESPFSVYDIWTLQGMTYHNRPDVDWGCSQYLLLYKKQSDFRQQDASFRKPYPPVSFEWGFS